LNLLPFAFFIISNYELPQKVLQVGHNKPKTAKKAQNRRRSETPLSLIRT